jgi:hypothetical protein
MSFALSCFQSAYAVSSIQNFNEVNRMRQTGCRCNYIYLSRHNFLSLQTKMLLRYCSYADNKSDKLPMFTESFFLSGYIQEACVIPCPFDCKLSDWSSWGSCSSSCGIGVRIRSKWLKEKPYSGGRPCPKLDLKNQVK